MARNFKGLGAAALMLGLGLDFAATAHAAAPASSPGTALAVMQASEALASDNCAQAVKPLNLLWNDPVLESSDPDLAAQFRLRLIACTAEQSGLREALSLSADNITRPGSGLTAFDMHAFLLLSAQQPAAAADTLEAAMTRFPDKAADLSDMTMLGALVQLRDSDAPRGLLLLDHAEQVHWQPHAMAARPAVGVMRVEGLRAAIAAGKADAAALYRADLKTEAFSYIISQGDGLISAADTAPADVEPMIGAQIAEAKAAVVKDPTDLSTLAYLMTLERSDGQPDPALTQLNGILALIDQYGLKNFQNQDTYGELLADRAQLMADMGRQGEALAAFQDGAKRLEGLPSGDFYAAYAAYLVARGDNQGAVDLVSNLDVTGFDDTQKVRLIVNDACAFGHLNDKINYASFMGVLGDPSVRVWPRLCAGDADGAATDMVAAINQPEWRNTVILMMQTMTQGLPASPAETSDQSAMAALKGRDDVTGAAKAASILVRSWPLRY